MSATEIVEDAVRAAEAADSLGAVWCLDGAAAREAAHAIDERVRAGSSPGPFAGVPILVKDAFAVAGLPGGAGGPPVDAPEDADVVAACRRAGAIVLGKAAMHQLGWGMTGQCPGRPPCLNPVVPGCSPGGSSSGSAAAVAAGIVPLALGVDAGGSVRLPAAWCGVVGFKPAQEALSRCGVAPMAPSFDTVGLLARTVHDCRWAYETLACAGQPLVLPDVCGARVATDPTLLDVVEPEIALAFERGLDALRCGGAVIVEERLANHRVPLGQLYAAELAAHWSETVDADPELFGADVRAGIAAGRAAAPRTVDDGRARLKRVRARASLRADVFACPTCPVGPLPLGAPDDVPRVGRLLRPFNLLDWPAISVPCPGQVSGAAVQLAAPRGREQWLFSLAGVVEEVL